MAKFCGVIGYAKPKEVSPGVWKDEIIEREYTGDTLRNIGNWTPSSYSTNDNMNVNNQISILTDPYAMENTHIMKYIEFMGHKWKITSFEVRYPRLILTVGGVYNGEQA